MELSRCPTLPPELWIRVLGTIGKEEDLHSLWVDTRWVCSSFKETVEQIFRERHLPKTWIRFDLGTHYPEDGTKVVISSIFDFSHLSEDKRVAVFRDNECAEKHKALLSRRIHNYVETKMNTAEYVEAPRHCVQVRRALNDGPVPGITMDHENLELSCDWRQLYTAFFGEEKLCTMLGEATAGDQNGELEALKQQAVRGEIDMSTAIQQAFGKLGDVHDRCRKLARRARIKLQLRELGEEEEIDINKERIVLKRLTHMQQMASIEDLSDDELDTDREDETEDEDESGEWEDTDEDEDSSVDRMEAMLDLEEDETDSD